MGNIKIYIFSAIVLLVSIRFLIHKLLDCKFFDRFFIFDPEKLHSLVLKSIETHGKTDTKAIVHGFVDLLNADKAVSKHLNLRQDWILNNAAGAMGAIWIVHASVFLPRLFSVVEMRID